MLILITGASQGIGFEIVKRFILNKKNIVIAVSRNIKSLEKLKSNNNLDNLKIISVDINNETERKKIILEIKNLKSSLDILINNAGIILNKSFEHISSKELTDVYQTNVFSPFLLIKELLPHFNIKSRVHIVNIGSMGGVQGSIKFAGLSAYSSSKAALAGLTECLAEELKDENIAINCLALGAVQTEMLSRAFPNYKAPTTAKQMAVFICDFALNGKNYFNGKIIPVSFSTP